MSRSNPTNSVAAPYQIAYMTTIKKIGEERVNTKQKLEALGKSNEHDVERVALENKLKDLENESFAVMNEFFKNEEKNLHAWIESKRLGNRPWQAQPSEKMQPETVPQYEILGGSKKKSKRSKKSKKSKRSKKSNKSKKSKKSRGQY